MTERPRSRSRWRERALAAEEQLAAVEGLIAEVVAQHRADERHDWAEPTPQERYVGHYIAASVMAKLARERARGLNGQ